MNPGQPRAECLQPETLAAYIDDRLDARERADVERHLAECEECYELFAETVQTVGDSAVGLGPAGAAPARPPVNTLRWLAAAATLVLATTAGWWWLSPARRIDSAVASLAHAERNARFSSGRLSVDDRWATPPSATRGPGALAEASLDVRAAIVSIERASGGRESAQALHALGLARLAAGDLSESIANLEDAVALSQAQPDASLHADLAAVLLDRSGASHDVADALRALNHAEAALRVSAGYSPALFNRALAKEIIGPRSAAIEAWQSYISLEKRPEWADEAKRHLDALKSALAEPGAKTSALFRNVEGTLLPAWLLQAQGSDLGDMQTSWQTLRGSTKDVELTDLLGAIVGASSASAARHACARDAVDGLLDWKRQYEQIDSEAGRRAAERQGKALECLQLSRVGADIERALLQDRNTVYEELRQLADAAEAHGFLRKAALARISLGNTALRRTDLSNGLAMLTRASDIAVAAGDLELAATARAMLGDAYRQHGEEPRVWAELQRALQWLPHVSSPRLVYSIVRACADAARLEGYAAASLSFSGLLINPEVSWAYAGALGFAHLERADAFRQLDDPAQADRELQEAATLILSMDKGSVRDELENELHVVRGQLDSRRAPAAALSPLSLAFDYFAKHQTSFRMAAVLLDRGRAQRALGKTSEAEQDWLKGADLVENQQPAVRDEQLRISRFSSLWEVYAELIRSQSANPTEALRTAERARSRELLDSLARDQPLGRFAPVAGSELWSWIPPQSAAIVYCSLPEVLLRWTVRADGVSVQRLPLDQGRLDMLVRLAVADLKRGRSDAAAELGRVLLDGLELPASTTQLVVVPDGALHYLPFAALPYGSDGRFLVERWTLVTAPTLSTARALFTDRAGHADGPVLLAGYGGGTEDGLPPLPGVAAELLELERIYPQAITLSGAEATPAALLSHSQTSGIVHIASHAVISAAYPSRSHLVLAPGAAVSATGELVPADIAANRLRAHPVVVLSGCDTAIGHVYRGEGSLSLARPFLAAGASAVIATEWPLGDIDAPVMAAAIHNALRGDSPAAALAHAQRAAIRAGMTIDRWATFVAFGGF